jgi:hypothetical protein
LKTDIISDTPAFSGTGLNAIAIGLSAHYEWRQVRSNHVSFHNK